MSVLLFTLLAQQGIVSYTFIFRVVTGEVFADAKVKLLRSEVRAIARVKLSLPCFAEGKTSLSAG